MKNLLVKGGYVRIAEERLDNRCKALFWGDGWMTHERDTSSMR